MIPVAPGDVLPVPRRLRVLVVDATLERHGRMVCIEVKSSTKVDGADARGLIWMRERLGDQFHRGVVLYSGSLLFQLSEKVWALPLSSLWRAPVDHGN